VLQVHRCSYILSCRPHTRTRSHPNTVQYCIVTIKKNTRLINKPSYQFTSLPVTVLFNSVVIRKDLNFRILNLLSDLPNPDRPTEEIENGCYKISNFFQGIIPDTNPHPARSKISGISPGLDPRHCFLSLQFYDSSWKLNYSQLECSSYVEYDCTKCSLIIRRVHGPNVSIKTPKCCLYWCFIEFIDWRYSQSC
jgi:hypothetical protein